MPTKPSIITYALANSLLTALYIVLIGLFFSHAQQIFGNGESAFIPVVMLTLFVFSALVCGSLILGRPIIWYIDGQKKEALRLFGYTIFVFFIVLVIFAFVLYFINN